MRKAKKRETSRVNPKKKSTEKRRASAPRADARLQPAVAETTYKLGPPLQFAPMQREYLRVLLGKESSPAAGDGRQSGGNYATRLLTFAVWKRGI